MSTEDKIAAIRREVEERAENADWLPDANFIALATNGVVIYGVPLNDCEVDTFRQVWENQAGKFDHPGAWTLDRDIAAIWEMLERGKR